MIGPIREPSGTPPRVYPFWYLDHGADTLVRSEHDNTQVVRWCLREKSVVLTGSDPRDLIDPVSPAALRAEVRETMDRCLSTGLPIPMIAWQAFLGRSLLPDASHTRDGGGDLEKTGDELGS
jgi:hypothetical protein